MREQTVELLGSAVTAMPVEMNGGAVTLAVNRSVMNGGGDWVRRSIMELEEDLGSCNQRTQLPSADHQ